VYCVYATVLLKVKKMFTSVRAQVFFGTTGILVLSGITFFMGRRNKDGHNLFDVNK